MDETTDQPPALSPAQQKKAAKKAYDRRRYLRKQEELKAASKAAYAKFPEQKKAASKLAYETSPHQKKAAAKAAYATSPEQKKAASKAAYAKNPEQKKAASKAAYASNPEQKKAASKAAYASNPERKKAAAKAMYAKHPTKKRSQTQQRRQAHKREISRKQVVEQCNQPTTNSAGDYKLPIEVESRVKEALKWDQKKIEVEGKPGTFRMPVCIFCDCVIIGCEPVYQVEKQAILLQRSRVSVAAYNSYHGVDLHEELVKQYTVEDDLAGLLLSPRSKRVVKDGQGVTFEACKSCFNAWKKCSDQPPKFAIANGLAIGHVPRHIVSDYDVTEEMCALLAPVRPYAYVFAYYAGAHKSIRGHYSFFEADLTHTGSVMNYLSDINANPLVYCVLCGRMTPKQKELAKQRAQLDTSKLLRLLQWYVTESGHPGFENVTAPSECPQPVVIEDEETANNIDEEANPDIEHRFEGATYHFSSAREPNEDTGIFDSNQKFVAAMMERTMPTVAMSGGSYADRNDVCITNTCPYQFPFGEGAPHRKRRTRLSALECCKLYCRLSMKQFYRGDFLLILGHMHDRLRTFQTALIKCRSNKFGRSLADKVSQLQLKDFDELIRQNQTGHRVTGTAADYLRSVNASCAPVGHSEQAAKAARRKHFALDDHFGGSAVFLTTTPCDLCSVRIRVMENAGQEVTLPPLGNWDDADHIQDCLLDFDLRTKSRSFYPGACSLVFQHLVQIIIQCLIGWDPVTQTGTLGVLGELEAYSRTDEEQCRKTLHCHWQLWLKHFNEARNALYHENAIERKKARDALLEYIDSVICASYGDDFMIKHICRQEDSVPSTGEQVNNNDTNTVDTDTAATLNAKDAEEGDEASNKETSTSEEENHTTAAIVAPISDLFEECRDKNVLRKARHCDHCLQVKGKVIVCKTCGNTYTTKECIEMAMLAECTSSTQENEDGQDGNGENNKDFDLDTLSVWVDRLALRHPFDFDEHGEPTKHLQDQKLPPSQGYFANRELREMILHYKFDEHDSHHRMTCFKKGHECRAFLPTMSTKESYIHDNTTIAQTMEQFNETPGSSNYKTAKPTQVPDSSSDDDDSSTNSDDDSDIDMHHDTDKTTAKTREGDVNADKYVRTVRWHDLDGTCTEKSQYSIIPKRGIGSQYLNQHNKPISNVMGSNNNCTVGDAAHGYYVTLYTSKNNQNEERNGLQRIHASFARRMWIKQQNLLRQQAQREAGEQEEDEAGDEDDHDDNHGVTDEDSDGEPPNLTNRDERAQAESCNDDDISRQVEGLGRVMMGINALLSQNVVSATMAHLLICQDGQRFTYSHDFAHLLLQQVEDCLAEKEISFIFRRNRDKETGEVVQWPDASANDYLYRPCEMELMSDRAYRMQSRNGEDRNNFDQCCLYEFTMKYEKKYYTFKEMDDREGDKQSERDEDEKTTKRYEFMDEHPGHDYAYLVERKKAVIPIITANPGSICDVELLQVGIEHPRADTIRRREDYAKTALMLFYPFNYMKTLEEQLQLDGSYWNKFVSAGGLVPYDSTIDAHATCQRGKLWEYGKQILRNMQVRITVEKQMKRPPDPLVLGTQTPTSTGQRRNDNVDGDDNYYAMDISQLCEDMADDGCGTNNGMGLKDEDARSHNNLIKRANIDTRKIAKANTTFEREDSILAGSTSRGAAKRTSSGNSTSTNRDGFFSTTADGDDTSRYRQMLTFIHGATVGSHHQNNTTASGSPTDSSSAGGSTRTSTATPVGGRRGNAGGNNTQQDLIPTMATVAKESGNTLDDKQYMAYQIICCTFLLQLINEGSNANTDLGKYLDATGLSDHTSESAITSRKDVVKQLKEIGALDQLRMLLSGPAGCGKSTCIETAQEFAHKFCMGVAQAFNDYTFYFTSTTGSSAALFGGSTIHSAAHLNKTKITESMRTIWLQDVRILVIDEISFFKVSDIKQLDQQLKKLMGRSDLPYGGVSVIFSGDFHQMKPICKEENVLYSASPGALSWENTINCAIFLENTHRFKDDPEFGEILRRMRMGEDTIEDREAINERVINKNAGVFVPDNCADACYACPTNKERNGVTAAVFKQHILDTHPKVTDEEDPPDHTLMIEASIRTKAAMDEENNNCNANTTNSRRQGKKRDRFGKPKKRRKKYRKHYVSKVVHDTIVTQLGDSDILSTDRNTQNAKIEPVLRVYPRCPLMCNTNDDLEEGRGNGTACEVVSVKLKKNGNERKWKNWEGRKVWTVSVDDVEWIDCEHTPKPPKGKASRFRLTPKDFSATIDYPLHENLPPIKVGNAVVRQFPVNSNLATTGHKLQGMSKDVLIVNSWDYGCANWVYVVLSRVRTRKGLFLVRPLDLDKDFNVPQKLLDFEERMKRLKEQPIMDRFRRAGGY